jgi:hypothetical protein
MRRILWAAAASLMLFSLATPADAQRYYQGQRTSCPEGTRPVPETDNCVPLKRQRVLTSCPAGTVPVPQTDNCVPARRGSTVCYFNNGPRAGRSFDFAALGFKPIAIGSPCGDGLGSRGIAR